ncbi:DNA-directed RNA polymerase II subunit [Wickerhamomyces ciferrii]|uniref:DNA-directed RNA polymerase II subunit n=1 Tax=Wickerhamomyces ciferrii (strain ATCC 14091 / BCRC 22168 / CBS 111 / JCM 3599 / NBRC 0793 / NRRL Y-1031 F-60-10) TaxID=1206466 RepID=K0KTH9_WICCF|nr:DNA-directed RNA polymerase II subunit [Wickerhamomyces ciferrii]CCH44684.1 DNA-directed RNA polymerase II subunit [Wickerhamomyces ciferrii]
MNVSTSTSGIKRRTVKTLNEEEENAANLQLGSEFDIRQYDHDGEPMDLIALNLSEARIIIRSALKERKKIMTPNGEFRDQPLETLDQDDENDEANSNDDDNNEIAKAAIAVGANEVLKKTLDHLSTFSRFRDTQTCSAVEQLLKSPENSNLHPFELAQLGSLACDDVDEAKTLIPSLTNKKTDAELQNILNQLSRLETPY